MRSEALGETLGPSLFQLPPNFKYQPDLLTAFLKKLPTQRKFAFEFRHPSWSVPDAAALLEEYGVATVLTEAELSGASFTSNRATDFVYVRLRRTHHSRSTLEALATAIEAIQAREKFVYFRHEVGAPFWAAQLKWRLDKKGPFPDQRGFVWPDPSSGDEEQG